MKRPAQRTTGEPAFAKMPAKKPAKKSAKSARLGSKTAPRSSAKPKATSVRVLLLSGDELLQVTCGATWTTARLRQEVEKELKKTKKGAVTLDKLLHGHRQLVANDCLLHEAGLADGAEIQAILREPEELEEEPRGDSEDMEFDEFDEFDSDDSVYYMDRVRQARHSGEECIRGCGNRGCSYYGGECRACFDEH